MQKPGSSKNGRRVHPLLIHVSECESYTPGELYTVAGKVKEKETISINMDPTTNAKENDGGRINSQWQEFVNDTTFHGMKYVFMAKKQNVRRLIWLCLVVTAIGLFTYQVVERTQYYLAYHSTVSMKRVHTKSLNFPAVTICNYNSYRLTETAELGLYKYIHGIYSNVSFDNELPNEVKSSNTNDILLKTAHQVEDLIASCTWKGNPCNILVDFIPRFTRHGVCYIFNGNNESLTVTQPGSRFGLRLILNIEAYEYMKGPEDEAGIKVLLHDPKEEPLVKDLGFAVAPGTHTLIGIKQTEVNDLPKPHGNCCSEAAPISSCMFQSRALKIASECRCRESFLQSDIDDVPSCNMTKTFTCVLREWYNMKEEDVNYTCPVPCQQITYEPVLSYSHLLKLSSPDKLSEERQSKVKDDYAHAREVGRRLDRERAAEDLKIVRTMKEKADSYQKNILSSLSYLSDDSSNWTEIFKFINRSCNILRIEINIRKKAHVHITHFGRYSRNLLSPLRYIRYLFRHFSDRCVIVTITQTTTTNITMADRSNRYCYTWTYYFSYAIAYLSEKIGHLNIMMKTVLKYIDGQGHLLNSTAGFYVTCMNKRLDLNGSWALMLEGADRACASFLSRTSSLISRIQAIQKLLDFHEWFEADTSPANEGCSLSEQQTWDRLMEINKQFELAIQENIHEAVHSCLISNNQSTVNGIELFDSLYESYQEGNEVNTKINGSYYSDALNETIENIATEHNRCKQLSSKYIKTLEKVKNIISLDENYNPYFPSQEILFNIFNGIPNDNRRREDTMDAMNKTQQERQKSLNETDMENALKYEPIKRLENATKTHMQQLQKQLNDSDTELKGLREVIDKWLEETVKAKFKDYFMDNFIKMDVFYRSLSYEEIVQQKAFEFLSLLGEIGGFLGLLLGASVLTVFELLDYLAVVALKKCKTTNDCFSVKN